MSEKEGRFGEEQDFDVKSFVVQEKYVLVRLMWVICKHWNDEFSER